MSTRKESDYGIELAYRCFKCPNKFFYAGFNNEMKLHLEVQHQIKNPVEFVENNL